MKLAAVDVGSNAARLQICRVITKKSGIDFKLLESIRFPLRLGEDVFKDKYISPQKEQNIMKFFGACKLLMELHEVDDYLMCATSAMRDAKNGNQIVEKIKQEFGLNLTIITGNQESEYVNKANASKLCRIDQVLLGPGRVWQRVSGHQLQKHLEPQIPDAGH